MEKTQRLIALGVGLCLLACSPASAAVAYTWSGDGGNWTDPNNWSPFGVPTTGDTATIGNGVDAITCIADGGLGGIPASIVVSANATVDVNADLWDPNGVNIAMDVYGTVISGPGNNGYDLSLYDGSELRSDEVGVLSATSQTFTVMGGTTRFTRDIPDPNNRTNESRYDSTIAGSGVIEVWVEQYADPLKDRIKFRRAVSFDGELDVVQGRLALASTDVTEILAATLFTVQPGADLRVAEDKLNDQGALILLGSGAGAGHLVMRGSATIGSATFGGVAVPPGTYEAGVDYPDYLQVYPAWTGNHSLTVLPEPGTMLLAALGGAGLLLRRRKA